MADNLQDIYKRDAHRERGLLQRPRVAQYHAAAAAQHTDIDGRWKRLRPLGDPDAAIRAAEERDLELAIQASLQERQQVIASELHCAKCMHV